MKKILITGNFSFPRGNAAGSRVLGTGYLLRKLGYEVIYIGMSDRLDRNSNLEDTKRNFEGFNYYNLPYPKGFRDWISFGKNYME